MDLFLRRGGRGDGRYSGPSHPAADVQRVLFYPRDECPLFLLSYRLFERQYGQYLHHLEERSRIQNELNRRNTLLEAIIQRATDAIFVKDLEGRYVIFNEGSAAMLEIPANEALHHRDEDLFSPETAEKIRRDDETILRERGIRCYEEDILSRSGTHKTIAITKGTLIDAHGEVFGIFGISHDITQRIRHEMEIWDAKERFDRLAHTDPLTSLPNRLSLAEYMGAQCGYGEPFALFFLDLDAFQSINDAYGHRFGDLLLISIAKLLSSVFPEEAYIARTGGDEFAVLWHCTAAEKIVTVMEELRSLLDRPLRIESTDLYITSSVGIALFPTDAAHPDELLQNADAAMYHAKKQGKNTYSFYTASLTEEVLYRTSVATQLKQSLSQEGLTLYYQPQIDARDESVIGFEGLLRWFTPTGAIPPNVFIPIAEESGLIQSIGEFVLTRGCESAARWEREGLSYGRIALNVSAKQLLHPEFVSVVERITRESGCRADSIELEITESSILDNPDYTIGVLHALKERGYHISIDDFGTGYSSLSYLKNLPVDKLKIDQSFIRDIPQEPKNQTIVKTIIALCEGLGMETIAEGVETAEELSFLRENGLYAIQGYYYHKPGEEKVIEALLRG
jgi:diguanylate cyclase (GGDEF)-like protein/PAS domain S-box-containing protein